MQSDSCDGEKEIWNDVGRPLSRVIYVTSAYILSYLSVISYGTHLLLKVEGAKTLNGAIAAAQADLPFIFVSYIVVTAVAIICLRPSLGSYSWVHMSSPSRRGVRLAFVGLLGGLTASLIASPLPVLGTHKGVEAAAVQIAEVVDYGHSAMLVLPIALVLAFVVALCTEVLFRGIIFRSLTGHAATLAAAIASCLLCSLVWPIYNPVAGIILGMVSALLFFKTKRIAPSVVANLSFVLVGPVCSVVFHRLL